ncbi:MAG: hypothetical protein JXR03_17715 [Cyclobacteriaceae bacterium]
MKRFKRIMRLIGLVLLILMASFGVAPIPFNAREKYMNNEVKIEQVKIKDEEDEEQELKEIE